MSHSPHLPEDLERPEPGEEQLLDLIARQSVRLMERASRAQGKPVRDAHPKQHGCVRATFEVGELPPHLAHGVFREPRTFPAWIRFSSASPLAKPDRIPDGRGLSIKLMGVAGPKLLPQDPDATTQDFLLVTSPVFFIRTLRDYSRFFRIPLALRPLYFLLPWHWKEAGIARRALIAPSNLLRIPYWSTTPYRLGPHAMKYMVRPHDREPDATPPLDFPENGLTRTMAESLRRNDALFDFMVQLRTDPKTMPIEDSTVEWDEVRAPWQKVATVRIPRQEFDFPARIAFGQNLSYNPWHSLPEHQPLGGINRARRRAYVEVSRLRHARSGTPVREPREDDPVE